MKVAIIVLLALMASALASPTHHVIDVERPLSPFDWSKIEPLDVFMEPIGPAPFVTPDSRIIGGHIIPHNSVPYQCFIIVNGASFCGCSIIGRSMMLSAAHCTMNARSVQLVLGAHDRNQNEATQQILSPTGVINHPNYNDSGQISNDISLLRLNTPITLTSAVQIIGLASGSNTYAGRSAFLSGWGRTNTDIHPDELHGVTLVVITNAECQQSFGDIIIDSTICTSGFSGNGVVSACHGDSGGPLVVENIQIGTVSFAAGSCFIGYPTGYARISYYRDWILQNGGV